MKCIDKTCIFVENKGNYSIYEEDHDSSTDVPNQSVWMWNSRFWKKYSEEDNKRKPLGVNHYYIMSHSQL